MASSPLIASRDFLLIARFSAGVGLGSATDTQISLLSCFQPNGKDVTVHHNNETKMQYSEPNGSCWMQKVKLLLLQWIE